MLSREMMERKWTKTHVEVAPHCPRCASSNTKFCYYNNYSFSQPRYFCKGCRRYWTKGGSLRNVPVGGGCRKSRRAKSVRDERSSISSNFSKNCDSYHCSNGDMGSVNCADIDLAVVFAKFLNQDPSNFQAESSEELISVTNNSSTPDSDCQQLTTDADLIIQDSGLFQQLPHDDRHVQVLVSDQEHQEMINEFGFQSLLGDEMVQDALWSEATTTLAKNDTWQPQEFDSLIAADDQPRIPTNLMTDNLWSSFDLSGFEVFSRP